MRREQLEHVLRAASQIADDPTVLVIGSQAILGAIPEELPHDCVVSKLVAGREKDFVFAAALIASGLVEPALIAERIETLDVSSGLRQRLRNWIASQSSAS